MTIYELDGSLTQAGIVYWIVWLSVTVFSAWCVYEAVQAVAHFATWLKGLPFAQIRGRMFLWPKDRPEGRTPK